MNRENQNGLPGFLEAFEGQESPRSRKSPHPLDELLLVALSGVTSNLDES